MTANIFPVGSIVAFAGEKIAGSAVPGGSANNGWILCDGSQLSVKTYSALNQVIGSYYGANSANDFNVPDYRGQFLRGVDDGAQRDTDGRSQPRPDLSYNRGNERGVGTIQSSAILAHTHAVSEHNGVEGVQQFQIFGDEVSCADVTKTTRSTLATGGCGEFRPTNQYAYFFIKGEDTSAGQIEVLAGMVLAYGGDLSSTNAASRLAEMGWMLCDGRSLKQEDNAALYSALALNYGANYASDFCIPRYFGVFLRGVDGGAGRDPDIALRDAPRMDLPQKGASPKSVGSMQWSGFPTHIHSHAGHTGTQQGANRNDVFMTRVLTTPLLNNSSEYAGGGAENRPRNIALEYVVAQSNSASNQVPPGAIIAFAGDIHDPSVDLTSWLVCNGNQYGTGDYRDLFNAIGYAHGGSGAQFCVPDLRGRFVRAADHGSGVDKGPRTPAATGGNSDGVGSYEDHALNDHQHLYQSHNNTAEVPSKGDTQMLSPTSRTSINTGNTELAAPSSGVMPKGGTSTVESRPTNQAVYFLIKT